MWRVIALTNKINIYKSNTYHTPSAEEAPDNTLTLSSCSFTLERHRKRVQQQEEALEEAAAAAEPGAAGPHHGNMPVPIAVQGIRCQLQCGCCSNGGEGKPCYWSSKGEMGAWLGVWGGETNVVGMDRFEKRMKNGGGG